jgi:hypothetical protein
MRALKRRFCRDGFSIYAKSTPFRLETPQGAVESVSRGTGSLL